MILIKVSGEKSTQTAEFMDIIQQALTNAGKKALVAKTKEVVKGTSGKFDCVVVEKPLAESTNDPKAFDFLIGLTESAAYELAQDHGFLVRIWTRNGLPMTREKGLKADRVNLAIAHDTVVGWHIG